MILKNFQTIKINTQFFTIYITPELRFQVLSEIEKRLADKYPSILRSDVRKILQIILLEIIDALCRSQAVELRGFGRFSVTTRKSRLSRNPQDGSKVEVPSKRAIKWKCSNTLFNLLNKNIKESNLSNTH